MLGEACYQYSVHYNIITNDFTSQEKNFTLFHKMHLKYVTYSHNIDNKKIVMYGFFIYRLQFYRLMIYNNSNL